MTLVEFLEVLEVREEERVFQEKTARARGANQLLILLGALSGKKIPEHSANRIFNTLVHPEVSEAEDDLSQYAELIAESEERMRKASESGG